jgi:hypothetical protein
MLTAQTLSQNERVLRANGNDETKTQGQTLCKGRPGEGKSVQQVHGVQLASPPE